MTDITQEQLDGSSLSSFSGAAYNAIAKVARLEEVRLLRLVSDIKPKATVVPMTLSYGRELISCEHDEQASAAAAIFRFFVKSRQGNKQVVKIEADYAVLYAVGESAQPNAARAFVNNVGLFAAYPYFRALAAQIAWNAGMNIPPLPTIASTAYKSALATPNEEKE